MSQGTALTAALATGAAALGALGYYLYRQGLFKPIKLEEETIGPFVCVYKQYVGPYHRVSSEIKAVASAVERSPYVSPSNLCFGVYFDKPHDVPPERCRASVGVILQEGRGGSMKDLQKLAAKAGKEQWAVDGGVQVVVFPASRAITCELPFHGLLSLLLGVWRAYPRLELACAAAGEGSGDVKVYGSLEIYDPPNHTMRIGFPLNVRQVLLPFDIDAASPPASPSK